MYYNVWTLKHDNCNVMYTDTDKNIATNAFNIVNWLDLKLIMSLNLLKLMNVCII